MPICRAFERSQITLLYFIYISVGLGARLFGGSIPSEMALVSVRRRQLSIISCSSMQI